MRNVSLATLVAISISFSATTALAEAVPASGYIYMRQGVGELTEGCIAHAGGGLYVGVGPALSFPTPSGKTRDILFVSAAGDVRTVATDLNSIADCVYDAAANVLYVTDSGANFSGATTGDTVFAIPGDATNVAVDGLEVLPSGSLANAFGIDLFDGGLLVSDANGGGAGVVVFIDLSAETPVATTFATGFDYAGGIAVDGARVLVSEATSSFQSAIYSYSSAGVRESTFSGPTFDHGSIDIDVAADGGVLATGSPTIASIDAEGTVTPLVTGIDGGTGFDAFGGAVSVHPHTGQIDFLASSFTGADDDRSVHRLIPVGQLAAGGGNRLTDCTVEAFGLDLQPGMPGRAPRLAICIDGDACDADGTADGSCTYPLGLCVSVDDARNPDCAPTAVASVELVSTRLESVELTDLFADVNAALPNAETSCFFSRGVRVSTRALDNGLVRPGRATIKLRATTDEEDASHDNDVIRLVCEPAAP